MIITLNKGCCFRIQTSGVNLALQLPGGNLSRIKSNILIQLESKLPPRQEADFVIKGAGEYEIQGVRIQGFYPAGFSIKAEGIKTVYQNISPTNNSAEAKEKMSEADIMLIAAADSRQTTDALRQLHPKIIAAPENEAKKLEKELGLKAESLPKLTVKKKEFANIKEINLRLVSLQS